MREQPEVQALVEDQIGDAKGAGDHDRRHDDKALHVLTSLPIVSCAPSVVVHLDGGLMGILPQVLDIAIEP